MRAYTFCNSIDIVNIFHYSIKESFESVSFVVVGGGGGGGVVVVSGTLYYLMYDFHI
jgi:hypothetical protein